MFYFYLYQYANLAGGLMLSLFLRLHSKDELSHMRFSFRLLVSFPNGLICCVFTLKVFPLGFLSSYALSDKTLTTWYPLINFLSKGFLVKFLTKT